MNTLVSAIALTLLLTCFALFLPSVRIAKAGTITVPDDYATIQEAINHANEGDIVFVRNGTYHENVVVNKTVSLIGQNRYATSIDGSEGETAVVIAVNDVIVEGFTIRMSKRVGVGIDVTSNNSLIHENIIMDFKFAIITYGWTCNNVIIENLIMNNDAGIHAYGKRQLICKNILANNSVIGIHTVNGPPSDNIRVLRNIITNNTAGINVNGYRMLVSKNTVTNNTSGIRLSTIAYNSSMKSVIIGNIIANNTYGIITPGLNYYATICGNTIANNQYGMHFRWVRSYGIYHNNFVNNTKQVYSYETTAEWDNGYPSGGNHWDDYNGEDSKSGPRQNRTGSDGVGDTPYVVDENNTDTYPLMKPWTPILGDVSFDDEVGILDITSIASIYGSREIEPCWNPEADLAPPYGKIDILDLVTCTGHCGEKYP